jgi:hypothetical protein
VIYDTSECGGNGWWVVKDGGGTTSFPRPVILYHELWHAHEYGNGTLVSPLTLAQAAQAEVRAENAENDMRDMMGLDHRDPNDHSGGCGGGPVVCCVVASVATDALSEEVNALRPVRDLMLRRSDVGHDFFMHLHRDYYSVSPEVCRLMGATPSLNDFVRQNFVAPLVNALELLVLYTRNPNDEVALGRGVRAAREELPWLDGIRVRRMAQALAQPEGVERSCSALTTQDDFERDAPATIRQLIGSSLKPR